MNKQLLVALVFAMMPIVLILATPVSSSATAIVAVLFLCPVAYVLWLGAALCSFRLALLIAGPQHLVHWIVRTGLQFEIPFYWLRELAVSTYMRAHGIKRGAVQERYSSYKSLEYFKARAPDCQNRVCVNGQCALNQEVQFLVFAPCDGVLAYCGDFSRGCMGSAPVGLRCTAYQLFGGSFESALLDPQVVQAHKLAWAMYVTGRGDSARFYAPGQFSLRRIVCIDGDWPFSSELALQRIPRYLASLRRVLLIGQVSGAFCAVIVFGDCVVADHDFTRRGAYEVKMDLQFARGQQLGHIVLGRVIMVVYELSICQSFEKCEQTQFYFGDEALKVVDAHDCYV